MKPKVSADCHWILSRRWGPGTRIQLQLTMAMPNVLKLIAIQARAYTQDKPPKCELEQKFDLGKVLCHRRLGYADKPFQFKIKLTGNKLLF